MKTSGIRTKLHHFIDEIEDKRAIAMYTMFESEMDSDAQRKALIQAEREKYLRGEGRSYTPEEVREMALNKHKRNAL